MSSQDILSNGEIFKLTTYNGISVLIDSNGYFNASKICKDSGTKFKDISKYKYWTDYLDEYLDEFADTQLIIKKLEFSNDVKGVYIHPGLVNWLCMHLNYKYAIKVSKIMNILNEKTHENNSNLEDEIEKLKTLAVPEKTNNKKLRMERDWDGKLETEMRYWRAENKW